MAYISLEHVVKRYQMGEVTITAADDVTFTVEKGEFVIIVGPSGAGKTTVLNILGGMDACDEGTILVDGKQISGSTQRQLTDTMAMCGAHSLSEITRDMVRKF